VCIHFIAFCLVAEVALEQSEEIVHFNAEFLAVNESACIMR